jgi:hypothetical protein
MKRISQSLFEEIQKVTSEKPQEIEEKKNLMHDEDKDGDEDGADYMMKRRKAGGQSHAQAHAATRKHNEETEIEAEVELEEGISETIIKHDDFVLEITNNPTFADFLNAAKSFVESEEDAIAVAEAFYEEQDDSIIVEAFTRADIDAKVAAHQKAGHTVSMPKFSTMGGKPHAEYVVTDKETKVRRKYIHHGTTRRVENMGTPGKKDKGEK